MKKMNKMNEIENGKEENEELIFLFWWREWRYRYREHAMVRAADRGDRSGIERF